MPCFFSLHSRSRVKHWTISAAWIPVFLDSAYGKSNVMSQALDSLYRTYTGVKNKTKQMKKKKINNKQIFVLQNNPAHNALGGMHVLRWTWSSETKNWKDIRSERCPEQWEQMSFYSKAGCDSLFQLWQPTTWSGRHLACSVPSSKSPWLGPIKVTRRGSSQQSQRATTGLPNTMKLFTCKCEK